MVKRALLVWVIFSVLMNSIGCGGEGKFTGAKGEVKLMTLEPGHFHAALVQKTMYKQISPTVYVYAPAGAEVEDHLRRIEGFNSRSERPTSWEEKVYRGDDFLERMLEEKPGNVVVLSGNNRRKTKYIKACVEAGLNVLSDKPMCINSEGFGILEEAFSAAEKNGVLVYDIMTERSEITTILQKELVHNRELFGQLQKGTIDEPAVVKESVHHFFKYVAGNPIKRPGWYFDVTQQGEGIVDVTTHLVDLVMWECLPGEAIHYRKDIEIKSASRWPTIVTKKQYEKVTGLADFPDFLRDGLNEKGELACYANGEINFTLQGICAKVRVQWDFEAPEGAKDTHYSIMRGSRANIIIRQGKEQDYRPELYVEAVGGRSREEFSKAVREAVVELEKKYPGIGIEDEGDEWRITIPDKYRVGHEAHFGEVTERYLKYLADGELPQWEVPNMKAKYFITTGALEMAGR